MRETMVALLEPAEQAVEESTQGSAQSSAIEREILALLRRPARSPPSITDLRGELLASFTELEVQRAIVNLLNRRVVESIYTSQRICFKLSDKRTSS